MKTKAEIIQKLLDDRHISSEDAMVLLQIEKQIELVPYQPLSPYPLSPRYPWG